jgi:hypothetical protein
MSSHPAGGRISQRESIFMEWDREFGETVASRLKEGSREEYEKVQLFLRRAVERQEWLYGDMIMRIIWALLPAEAQKGISKGLEPETSKGSILDTVKPPPLPSGRVE